MKKTILIYTITCLALTANARIWTATDTGHTIHADVVRTSAHALK